MIANIRALLESQLARFSETMHLPVSATAQQAQSDVGGDLRVRIGIRRPFADTRQLRTALLIAADNIEAHLDRRRDRRQHQSRCLDKEAALEAEAS